MLKRNVTQQHLLLLAVLVLGLALVLSRGPSQPVAHAAGPVLSSPKGLSLAARAEGGPSPELSGGQVSLVGRVIDPQGEPVRGAKVSLVLNGTPLGASAENEHAPPLAESQPNGAFVVDLPAGEVGAIETLVLEISRPR